MTSGCKWATLVRCSLETLGYIQATAGFYWLVLLGCNPDLLGHILMTSDYDWATLDHRSLELPVSPEIVELVPDDFEFLRSFEQSN